MIILWEWRSIWIKYESHVISTYLISSRVDNENALFYTFILLYDIAHSQYRSVLHFRSKHPQKGIFNNSFVLAGMVCCAFDITLQHIFQTFQLLMWSKVKIQNYILVGIFISEFCPLLAEPKSHTVLYRKLSVYQLPCCGLSCQNLVRFTIFCTILKTPLLNLDYKYYINQGVYV